MDTNQTRPQQRSFEFDGRFSGDLLRCICNNRAICLCIAIFRTDNRQIGVLSMKFVVSLAVVVDTKHVSHLCSPRIGNFRIVPIVCGGDRSCWIERLNEIAVLQARVQCNSAIGSWRRACKTKPTGLKFSSSGTAGTGLLLIRLLVS